MMITKIGCFLLILSVSMVQGAEKKDDPSQFLPSSKLLRGEGKDLLNFSDSEHEEESEWGDVEVQVGQIGKQIKTVSQDVYELKINMGQLDRREKSSEDEIRNINRRLEAIEKNIAAIAGTEPVYYRVIRADMVLQLTCIFTLLNVAYTLASGQGVGPAFMALIGAYTFYYFFKFIRDAGTVAGNVAFRRPN